MSKRIKNEWNELKALVSKVNPLIMTFFVLSVVSMNLLANKSIDVVWNGMTIRDDLKTSMSISNPYVVNAQVIVTKAENKDKFADAESDKRYQNGRNTDHQPVV